MFGATAGAGDNAGADHPPLDVTATALHTDEQETESAAGEASLLEGLEPTHFEGSSGSDAPPSLAGLEPQAFEPPAPEVQPPRISQAFPALEEFAGLSHDEAPADSSPLQNPPALEAPSAPSIGDLPFIDTAAESPAASEPASFVSPASPSPEPAGADADFPEFDELPASPASMPAPAAHAAPVEEPVAEFAIGPEAAAPVVDDASPARPTPSSTGAFVTETMAELYIQQGFHDRAADVYRQLIEQRPGDAGLRDRLHALEARMAAASAPTPAIATVAVEEGPSIREFLGRFAARRPREAVAYVPTPPEPQAALPEADTEGAEPPMEMGDSQVEPMGVAERADAEAVAAPAREEAELAPSTELPFLDAYDEEPAGEPEPEAPAAAAPPAKPAPSMATPAGSISAIFGGAVAPDDEARADRLAAAFAPEPASASDSATSHAPSPSANGASPAPPPSVASAASENVDAGAGEPALLPAAGRPARPADTELSLDRVFRDPRPNPGARNSSGFSFDQFFSKTEGSTPAAPAPRAPEHGEAPAAGADDIAQFNAWLQGLKNK
jgi:hypothetical protein